MLALQFVAAREQRAVARREHRQDGLETGPETGGVDAGARQGLALDEGMQCRVDLQSASLDRFSSLVRTSSHGSR